MAFLSIRSWPLTDYPMFAYRVDYRENKISLYKYSILLSNGENRLLQRSFAYGFGANEWNISKLVIEKDIVSLKKIFSFWLNRQKYKSQVKEIIVTKLIATRPLNTGEKLKIEKKVVLKIPVGELDYF